MSPRRRPQHDRATDSRRAEPERSLDVDGWSVRPVTGAAGIRPYRCPGCDQEIRPRTPHVVVWPAGDVAATDRRHWHSTCWAARERRGVKVHRSKNAPRYG